MMAGLRLQFIRDRAALLDRQIRNAEPRIESPATFSIRDQCFGRTRVDTAAAAPAAIRRRRIESEWNRKQQLAQKEPGALLLVDQASVLSDPSQTRRARV